MKSLWHRPTRSTSAWVVILMMYAGIAMRSLHPQPARQAGTTPRVVPELFRKTGCLYCHGQTLEGTDKGPSLTGVGSRLAATKIEKQIRDGGEAMPAFGEVLAPEELKELVDYLAATKAGYKKLDTDVE